MAIDLIKDKIHVDTRRDALRLHLLIKSFQKDLNLSESDINSLIELREMGYGPSFFKSCVTKGFFKSEQTVRNAIARMTGMGILTYAKRGERSINPEFFPEVGSDKVIFQYLVGNL